ncbi:MAG TPA: hypothetical protein VJ801_13220 [Polyangia bacterium]|nr:hypothetical protein [Polyangia bacterium]
MSEPTQTEVDAVAVALRNLPGGDLSWEGLARAAIAALDKARGECVPVDVLIKKVREQWGRGHFVDDWFTWWLGRRGWLDDDKTPVVQTDRRKS